VTVVLVGTLNTGRADSVIALAADSARVAIDRTRLGAADGPASERLGPIEADSGKLFALSHRLPIAAGVYGARLTTRHVASGDQEIVTPEAERIPALMELCRRAFDGEDPERSGWRLDPDRYTVADAAERVRALWSTVFTPEYVGPDWSPGVFVAGYDPGGRNGLVYAVRARESGVTVVPSAANARQPAAGAPVTGFMLSPVGDGAIARLMRDNQFFRPDLTPAEMLELVEFLVTAEVMYSRLTGSPTSCACRPPVDLAVVRPGQPLAWMRRKLAQPIEQAAACR
jgi:hypothetical protein